MKYKVYDKIKKTFVTDCFDFILKPDGKLAINDFGDEIGIPRCIPLFYPTKDDNCWFDGIGGFHDSGLGWDPDGISCGECSEASCENCYVWKQRE